MESDCKLLKSQNEMLLQKTETPEDRSRKFNIRIFRVEQQHPQTKLCDSFGQQLVSSRTLSNGNNSNE